MREVKAPIKFVSCEPLLESIKFNDVKIFDWIIIGGCSPTKSHKEVQPEYGWVKSIEKQAWCANDIPVYFKPNMESRPKEYPK